METSGVMHNITSRTFQHERVRVKKLLAKAAEALVRGERWLANGARVQEDM